MVTVKQGLPFKKGAFSKLKTTIKMINGKNNLLKGNIINTVIKLIYPTLYTIKNF